MKLLLNTIKQACNGYQRLRLKLSERISFSISGRCIAILLVTTYLIFGPARAEADIVAAALAWGVTAILALTTLFVFFYGRSLRRSLLFSILSDQTIHQTPLPESKIISGQTVIVSLKSTTLTVPAWFKLNLKLHLSNNQLSLSEHILLGKHPNGCVIREKVVFPHRGDWQLSSAQLCFGDYTGLAHYRWSIDFQPQPSYRVHPPFVCADNWPIISSAQRSGDAQIDLHNRQGDPYDLKSYHPSDGIKKIVWKVYAKSGELIARHPEASMTPEGQVFVYCLAQRRDDRLCGQVLDYCQRLNEMKLQIFFGCQGMGSDEMAFSPQEIEDLMIATAWDSSTASTATILAELDRLLEKHREVAPQSIIERILLPITFETIEANLVDLDLIKVAEFVDSKKIKPVFLIAKEAHPVSINRSNTTAPGNMVNFLKKWFTIRDTESTHSKTIDGNNFLAELHNHSWELFLIES